MAHADPMAEQVRKTQKLERVAMAIFWEMNAVMHDHAIAWKRCDKKIVYRDAARAAIATLAHGCLQSAPSR